MLHNFFKKIGLESIVKCRFYTAAQDKAVPPGNVLADGSSYLVQRGLVGTTAFKNVFATIKFPFNDSVSAKYQADAIFCRTSPNGDSDYASLPIGSIAYQITFTTKVADGAVVWLKTGTGASTWTALQSAAPSTITDPGDAGAIPVAASGTVVLATAAGETRTMAIPAFLGERIAIAMGTDVGDAVVTVASAVDQDGATVLTFNDVGDYAVLEGVIVTGTTLGWRLIKAEGALVGNATYAGALVADPGDGLAISVKQSGTCILVSGGAETRTLAIPTFAGQKLTLVMNTDAGDIVTTVAQAIDAIGHVTITHNDVGDVISLVGVYVSGALRWRILNENGVLLGSAAGFGNIIADPGHAAAIPVIHKHLSIALTIGGVETNTLAIPTMVGQTLSLFADVLTSNERTITVASAINVANNTTMEFDAVSETIELKAITLAGALAWQVVANDGVTLA